MNKQDTIRAARGAVDVLRDHARFGLSHHQRDPLVMAIHAVIDAYESQAAHGGTAPHPELVARLRQRAAHEWVEDVDSDIPPEITWRELSEISALLTQAADALEAGTAAAFLSQHQEKDQEG